MARLWRDTPAMPSTGHVGHASPDRLRCVSQVTRPEADTRGRTLFSRSNLSDIGCVVWNLEVGKVKGPHVPEYKRARPFAFTMYLCLATDDMKWTGQTTQGWMCDLYIYSPTT